MQEGYKDSKSSIPVYPGYLETIQPPRIYYIRPRYYVY
jgi:hypothetical protein